MKVNDADSILKQVAIKNGVSEQEVRQEIQKAIKIAKDNQNSKGQAQWKKMKYKGEYPTPEELITNMIDKYEYKHGECR